MISWAELNDGTVWDRALAALGGHPLQSAFWGDARRAVDGIEDLRLAWGGAEPLAVIRVEARPLPFGGKVAWSPRGPAAPLDPEAQGTLRELLRARGFVLLVNDPWREAQTPAPRNPRTIWLDLSRGRDNLMAALDKQWRYGVRRAAREGVTVAPAADEAEVAQFFEKCLQVSQAKGFELPGSLALMNRLLAQPQNGEVEARLMLARHAGQIAAGAFLMRCGRSLHYFWGATDRRFAKQNVGEAVQWAAIEWGLERGCQRYDLEGVEPTGNPGVYAFKCKMGGEEVALVGQTFAPLGLRGRLARTALEARDALRRGR